jgi:chitodextrinase
VAAYGFNEGTGSTVSDLSGHNLTGTIVGATWTNQGKYGNALSFNGTSSYVDLGNPAALQLTGSMTLEAWVKAAANPTNDGQIVAKSDTSAGWQLKTTPDTGPEMFGVFVTNSAGSRVKRFSTTTRSLNAWYHIAGVYNAAGTLNIYVNGALDNGTLQGTIPAANLNAAVNANIGRRAGGYYFNGMIDEVRIYNRALSQTEIQTDMVTPLGGTADSLAPTMPANLTAAVSESTINLSWTASTDYVGVSKYLVERCQGVGCTGFAQVGTSTGTTYSDAGLVLNTSYSYRIRATDAANNLSSYSNVASTTTPVAISGLVAAYGLNEGSGTTIGDSSGNGISGALQSATWTAGGKYGNALSFNGTNSYVDLGNPAALQLTGSMTVEAWIKAVADPLNDGQIISKANDSGGWQLKTSPDTGSHTFGAKVSGNAIGKRYSNAVRALNTWYHVASVYNAATQALSLYVNGVLDNGTLQGTVPSLQILQNINVNIGRRTGGYYFNGIIDEIRIYHRALTQSEIQSDMNTPVGTSNPPTDTQAPTAPGSLAASASSQTQINLSWVASTDNIAVAGYRVERCQGSGCSSFAQIATPTGTTYTNTGLTPGTSYRYRARAIDGSGNLSSYSNVATATTSAPVAPSITQQPTNKTVTAGQMATFSVTASGTTPLSYQWQKGTTNISGATSASYTTPPATLADSGSQFRVIVSNSVGNVTSNPATLTVNATTAANVLTYHNDNGRTGQNLSETILTTGNVNQTQFGKLANYSVDGKVDAQPLYASNVAIPSNGTHNLLIVATEHGSVYAFDADTGTQIWKKSMLGTGESPSDDRGCGQVTPEIGVTATPVIDRSRGPNGAIYVVAMSKNGSTYHHRLHALDLAAGTELFGGPKEITAQYPGTGDGSNGTHVIFDPKQYKERVGLLLMNGVIHTAWASHCDIRPYTGWLMSFNADTLAQTSVLNITPNGGFGAIWMAGAGLAADNSGNYYFLDGNGDFGTTLNSNGFPVNGNFGNAFMKISTIGGTLAVADYFEMFNQLDENNNDRDLGSGGAMVLPDLTDGSGNVKHLAVGVGKDAHMYVVNRDNMGKFNSSTNNIYQDITGALGGVFAMPAYFNGKVYYGAVNDEVKAFTITNARFSTTASAQTPNSFNYPGATPSVSANGTSNGIVWAAENGSTAVLHAYDATNLNEIYNSNQAANSRDHFGAGNKYITPTIVNGKVFVGTTNSVAVFGLLPQIDVAAGAWFNYAPVDNKTSVGVFVSVVFHNSPWNGIWLLP